MLRKILKDQRGFTLMELIIVVTILAVLAGVALLNTGGIDDDAKVSAAKTDIATLATAAKVYKIKTGNLPANLAALAADNGNYKAMLDSIPKDATDTTQNYSFTVDNTAKTVTIATHDNLYPYVVK